MAVLRIFINGRFLSQSLSGVQRYAAEMVRSIDELAGTAALPKSISSAHWTLLVPPNSSSNLALRNIEVAQVGTRSGHVWDQIDLARAARSGPLISLANSGPLLHRDQRVVLHDAQVFKHPEFFGWKYAFAHRQLGRLLALRSRIFTVSEFSRGELADSLGLPERTIGVCPNSAEHLARVHPDTAVLKRFQLEAGRYFLAVGSLKKNKNVQVAIEAMRLLGRTDYPLIVVGGENDRVFSRGETPTAPVANVIFAGRLPDEGLAALYQHATAFVFPSLYEGFGVPPLEAMLFGCPVIAADIPPVRETCAEAVRYFDPTDPRGLAARLNEQIAGGPMREAERAAQQARLSIYSWRKSALALLSSFG
ncbi:glycosyltransferase family 1 protein [Bradyrhizobium sp. Arg816]|uniref:glycosyltransferase family 4 protein n=1 Tax=Bradyrhizobium sp. Arg816 TaxID=2998491 RepID=UPI0027B9164B|nr:glycosyltransferase family 1 protein [Bradyrhizobium sp. Arg816]